jgi:transposase
MGKAHTIHNIHYILKKNQFVEAVIAGTSVKEAATMNNIHPCTAYNIVKKYCTTRTVSWLPQSGCPPLLSKCNKYFLIWTATKECRLPFTELGNAANLNVSASTICNVMATANYHQRVVKRYYISWWLIRSWGYTRQKSIGVGYKRSGVRLYSLISVISTLAITVVTFMLYNSLGKNCMRTV